MIKKSLTVLAIDSSTSVCSVAVARQDVMLADVMMTDRGQAEALVPAIAAALEQSGRGWSDIDLIAVTVGPGSFTGLRIGLAAARGLALVHGTPILGMTTADLLAEDVDLAQIDGRTLLVAIDSRREDLFLQAFSADRQPLGEIRALTVEAGLGRLPGPLLVVGDAAQRFSGLRDNIEIAFSRPRAALLALLAEGRYQGGRALPAQPLYLRPPDVTLLMRQ
jgi:tRNA threonylcarbamoyladenosine biosynthesis protein TsaB